MGAVRIDAKDAKAIARVIREWLPGTAQYLLDEINSLDRNDEVTPADFDRIAECCDGMTRALRVLAAMEGATHE
jgi:hypothetical protein